MTVPLSDFRLTAEDCLDWFRASDIARRGLCRNCRSFLFWQGNREDVIAVSLGSLNPPTGLQLAKHIHVRDKGDYDEIRDGLAQEEA